MLGPIPYDYKVYWGDAPDDYQADFIMLPFHTRAVHCTVMDSPGMLKFTYDGVEELPEREFGIGFERVEAIRGFKIKNKYPGNICRFQVMPLR